MEVISRFPARRPCGLGLREPAKRYARRPCRSSGRGMPADRGEPPFRGGWASGDSGVGKLPAPDESKAEHIQAETVTRGLGRWAEEGARTENFNPKNKIRSPDKPCGDFKEIGKITLLL